MSAYTVKDLVITSRKAVSCSLLKCIQNFCANQKQYARHPADTECKVLNYSKMLYYNLKNFENNLAGHSTNVEWWYQNRLSIQISYGPEHDSCYISLHYF